MSLAPADEVISMDTREASPAHLLIKIESFSLLPKCGIDRKFETREFSAGNYKWRLVIYPNGRGTGKDGDYVSVYLAIADTISLPQNWEVNAVFSIFIFNQISGNYLYTPGKTRRFFPMKTEWGFPKFMSKRVLTKPSNGYLLDDNCVFGAEIFLNENKVVTECLSLKNVTVPFKEVWEIPEFSKLRNSWTSEEFTAGGGKWKIKLYPNGVAEGACSFLSVYLKYVGSDNNNTAGARVKARYSICIKNHLDSDKHHKETASCWFDASDNGWGWHSFLPLASLNDANGGFLVKDCCVLVVKIYVEAVAQ